MLNIIKIKDSSQKKQILSQFSHDEIGVLVSDIKTKLQIENFLLEKASHLSHYSVSRIQEFFENLFYQLKPDWLLVSDSFLSQMFLEFISNSKEPYLKHLNNPQILMECLEQFLPILFHPESSELLNEWFSKKDESSAKRWKYWYITCQNFFEVMLAKKIIHKSGLKSLIMNEIEKIESFHFPKKNIVVDLGLSLDPCDCFILKEVSKKIDVTFLAPDFNKKEFYKCDDTVYNDLIKDTAPSQIQSISEKKSKQTQVFKIKNETQLQEVKRAVAQVRSWLDSGVLLKDISILAPDIESYWFALLAHFKKENIPVKKSITGRLVDYPYISYWLSALYLHLDINDFSKLEHYFFYNDKGSFYNFRNKYFNFSESKNVKFVKHDKKRNIHDKVTGRDFIDWSLSFLPKEMNKEVLDCIINVVQNFTLDETLRYRSWLKILESEIFNQNIELEEEQSVGVSCLSFNAIDSINASHVFILGLDENSLQVKFSKILNQKDRNSLVIDLGFILPYPHYKENEYKLLWFLQSSHLEEVFFSFSSTNFKGEVLTPSLFYILSNSLFKAQEIELKNLTVWDSLKQQKDLEAILKNFEKDFAQNIKPALQEPICFKSVEEISLSFNRLKTYAECGFRYAAKYLFKLEDKGFQDRELNPMDLGNLIHKLFQEILSQESLEKALENMDTILETIKPKDYKFVHPAQWEIMQKFLKRLSAEFIEKERLRQEALPEMKPVFFEKDIKTYWDKKSSQLSDKGDYLFKGSIDRIDRDTKDNSLWLIDYKGSGYVHIKSWLKNNLFQLPLYAQAVQKNLIEGVKGGISALLYYTYKDFSYKGYVDKKYKGQFFKEKIFFDSEELNKSLKETNEKVKDLLSLIEKGEFFAKPEKEETCDKCNWRKWCRAKHLN